MDSKREVPQCSAVASFLKKRNFIMNCKNPVGWVAKAKAPPVIHNFISRRENKKKKKKKKHERFKRKQKKTLTRNLLFFFFFFFFHKKTTKNSNQ